MEKPIELTIVMPCLNEAETLKICIDKAMKYLNDNNISGEVVIGDNGSTNSTNRIGRDSFRNRDSNCTASRGGCCWGRATATAATRCPRPRGSPPLRASTWTPRLTARACSRYRAPAARPRSPCPSRPSPSTPR